jgi:hypothetical protein
LGQQATQGIGFGIAHSRKFSDSFKNDKLRFASKCDAAEEGNDPRSGALMVI